MAIDRAKGTSDASAGATAALEACSGAVARAFAAADVTGGGAFAQAALTPDCLAYLGRTIIRRGEAVLSIDAGAMRTRRGRSRTRPGPQSDSSCRCRSTARIQPWRR